tara:strand:+ start:1443 stop:1787 length:345 start_codon:yes stop_codon:yes gene_type:complete
MKLVGRAFEDMEPGDHVMCRDSSVTKAAPEIANAIVVKKCRAGDWPKLRKVDGLGERNLQAMADGPIMEPLRLYLPSGRLTEAEYQQRLREDFERAGIELPVERDEQTIDMFGG